MHRLRKMACILLLLVLLPVTALRADAAEEESRLYIKQILSCFLNEQPEADTRKYLTWLAELDPAQADTWTKIVEQWYWVNGEMEVHEAVLPDGLPQDDSMAIVVMGLQLNENGSIKPELLDRLSVAIRSARKYPNAYIICTGGPTSGDGTVTEAGEMAQWLKICGIDESRILLEEGSFSTTENAQNTCALIHDLYPQITSLAVVTSDYHIRRSCMMFSAASLCASAGEAEPIKVISNAVCTVENMEEESIRTKVWGLAILAGVDMPVS